MATGDTVEVRLLGNSYKLQAGDNPEHVKSVANFVKSKLDEISKAAPDYSNTQLAILTALNIADDYLKGSDVPSGEDESQIKEKVKTLIEKAEIGQEELF